MNLIIFNGEKKEKKREIEIEKKNTTQNQYVIRTMCVYDGIAWHGMRNVTTFFIV